MQIKQATFVVAAFAAQQAIATGWLDAAAYSCPSNTKNHCSEKQQAGYDWKDLSTGLFTSYGSNKFSGFTCADSFEKRNVHSKRDFQSKCIKANLNDHPSMSGNAFSIDQMQISLSHDADVEAHYGMPDGSICKETHTCSSEGTVVKNSQCGGAKSVTFKPGKDAPKDCSIGVHSVDFHCGTPSQPPPYSPSTSVSPESTTSSSVPAPTCYGKECASSSTSVAPASSSASPPPCYGDGCSTPASSAAPESSSAASPPCYGDGCTYSPPTVATTSSAAPTTSSAAPVPSCYGKDCSTSSVAPASSSVHPSCYSDKCTTSSTPVSPTTSSIPPPCYGKDCSTSSAAPASSSAPPPCYGVDCTLPISSSSAAPVSSSSPPPPPPPSPPKPHCPEVLPRCLKTWMFLTTCKDNTDHNCFCGNEKFIKNAMACLSAWSISHSDIEAAVSYLMGICAAHVPQNPAIVTACPSGVTPHPSPVASSEASSSTAGATAPCTTITYSTSTLTTTVTVPQVQLTTSTITVEGSTTSCSVGLGPATTPPPPPTSASAYATPYPTPYPMGPSSAAFISSAPVPYTPGAAGSSTLGTSWGTGWVPGASASASPVVPYNNGGCVRSVSGVVAAFVAVVIAAVVTV